MNSSELLDERVQVTLFILGDHSSLKILYTLDHIGEMNFSQLRDRLHINPATLSKKLKLLVRVGLIASDRTHDNLHVYYSIANHQKVIRKITEAVDKLSENLQ